VPETIGRLILVTAAAALLVAASVVPVVTIAGIAARDTAKTFNTLPVGQLGAAPVRSVLYDSGGDVIAYLYPYDVYRVPVSYDQIAPVMRNAIVAIEDSSFYSQGALDPRGTVRALLHNSGGSGLQGASTIAQQYVKNVKVLQAGNDQKAIANAVYPNLQRKILDLRLAADVEHELTQNQLLASYLNVAYFNNHAWGIEVASQVYFSEHASQLTLPQAALLAGIVQSPSAYDPVANPGAAKYRRNTVLQRMWQLHYISHATYLAAAKTPIVLTMSSAPLQTGCTSPGAANEAFFCDYVQHVLENDYPSIWNQINNAGDLAIYTTMNMQDQVAADNAVNYVQPDGNYSANPGNNADTEVLIQPGTGAVQAIAVNRVYGSGGYDDSIDYAVNSQYGGDPYGVQTGSSSKIFTLITALEQGLPFGHQISIQNPQTIGPFSSCSGQYVPPHSFSNAEAAFSGTETYMMAEATVESVNTYFVNLEKQVGLCNVVRTAVAMGMTRADGGSLLQPDKSLGLQSADNVSSFTLGAVGVSPMSMAAAYATVAAGATRLSPRESPPPPTTSCNGCWCPRAPRPAGTRPATSRLRKRAPPTAASTRPSRAGRRRWPATCRCSTRAIRRAPARWLVGAPATWTSMARTAPVRCSVTTHLARRGKRRLRTPTSARTCRSRARLARSSRRAPDSGRRPAVAIRRTRATTRTRTPLPAPAAAAVATATVRSHQPRTRARSDAAPRPPHKAGVGSARALRGGRNAGAL
jgi:membrane peptidoglycan carboxypeptidase